MYEYVHARAGCRALGRGALTASAGCPGLRTRGLTTNFSRYTVGRAVRLRSRALAFGGASWVRVPCLLPFFVCLSPPPSPPLPAPRAILEQFPRAPSFCCASMRVHTLRSTFFTAVHSRPRASRRGDLSTHGTPQILSDRLVAWHVLQKVLCCALRLRFTAVLRRRSLHAAFVRLASSSTGQFMPSQPGCFST